MSNETISKRNLKNASACGGVLIVNSGIRAIICSVSIEDSSCCNVADKKMLSAALLKSNTFIGMFAFSTTATNVWVNLSLLSICGSRCFRTVFGSIVTPRDEKKNK